MEDNNWRKVLPDSQQAVWNKLINNTNRWQELGFYLAGGTGLALQLGHRQSVDFDFFSEKKDTGQKTYEWLQSYEGLNLTELDANTFHGELDSVKLSFIGGYKYPLVDSFVEIKRLHLASIEDLGAMKLLAITSRATMRDYIDIAAIIKNGTALTTLLKASRKKYGSSFNEMVPIRALSAYNSDDMDKEIPTILDEELKNNWQSIINKAVSNL